MQILERTIFPLIALEWLVFGGSVYAASALRFIGEPDWSFYHNLGATLPHVIINTSVMFVSMAAMGLYQVRSREEPISMFVRVLMAFAFGTILSILLFYIFPQLDLGRGIFGLTMIFSLLAVGTIRPLFFQFLDQHYPGDKVLILGAGHRAAHIPTSLRRRSDRRGIRIIGFRPGINEEIQVDEELLLDAKGPIYDLAEKLKIVEIVLAFDDRRTSLPMQELLECRLKGINVIDLATFFERQAGKLQLSLLNFSDFVFSDGISTTQTSEFIERLFDVLCSTIIFLITSPIMALAALAIWIESGFKGSIIFRQTRIGESGNAFEVIKFRSMREDAEADGQARWAKVNDDRVTKVGRFIRKIRIDELPQCWNVLKGEMSFVGPRPERPEFIKELKKSIPYYSLRHIVKPGLTGWAQISYPYGENEKDAEEKLKYDLYYVKNKTLFFDILILLRTLEIVLFGKGAGR